jgi:lipopolysaccharide transport protein LptA
LWQEDNFVRGDKVSIYRDSKRMDASGHVQSALYQARRKAPNGGNSVVPVFATAEKMWYSDPERLIHYETNVDIKQGTDRLTGGTADVYLQKDKGEVERTVAERDVVLTQPGRRGTGTWAQYTAADDSVILKGSPARVEDAQQGNTESGRLTVYLGESRVVADDSRGSQSAGRVHSTHRVKKQD